MVNPVSESLLLYPGLALALSVIFGFWLSRLGKPYQQVVFNIHKLLALAVVVMVALGFNQRFKSEVISTEWLLLMILIAIMTIILFASGALMSLEKWNYHWLKWIHRLASITLVLGAVGWVFYKPM